MTKSLAVCVLFHLLYGCTPASLSLGSRAVRLPAERPLELVRVTRLDDTLWTPTVSDRRPVVSGLKVCALAVTPSRLFDVSDDGRWLAFLGEHRGRRDVFLRSLAGRGRRRRLTSHGDVMEVAFSPQGRWIAYTHQRDGNWNVDVVSTSNGRVVHRIPADSASPSYSPTFAHDGSRLFFLREGRTVERSDSVVRLDVWEYEFSTGHLTSRTEAGGQPTLMPNGRTLVVVRGTAGPFAELWTVDLESGARQLLIGSSERGFLTPAVSPAGTHVALTSRTGDCGSSVPRNLDVYLVRADGGGLTQLTFHPEHDFHPRWSSDGRFIYFLSQRSGKWHIWRMSVPVP
jgi:Tol biopolymer transport system component